MINMLIKLLDTPNHNDKHSIDFLMAINHTLDKRFTFLAHLVQKLLPKTIFGGHIGFLQQIYQDVHIWCDSPGS